jgi:hypothetical protein
MPRFKEQNSLFVLLFLIAIVQPVQLQYEAKFGVAALPLHQAYPFPRKLSIYD